MEHEFLVANVHIVVDGERIWLDEELAEACLSGCRDFSSAPSLLPHPVIFRASRPIPDSTSDPSRGTHHRPLSLLLFPQISDPFSCNICFWPIICLLRALLGFAFFSS